MKQFLSTITLLIIFTSPLLAQSPFQLSLTPDVALHPRTEKIEGLSIGIWAENPHKAVAFGVAQGARGDSSGLSIALLINYAESYKGIQWAPANIASGNYTGWQTGIINYTEGDLKGLQTGTVNYAKNLTGIQFGFFNYAEHVERGIQIGTINIMPENVFLSNLPEELSPVMVFVNWKL